MIKKSDSKNIWKSLKKPILILAPMEDVTDTVFRQIIADLGKPDLFFTEFVNVDGLFSPGEIAIKHRLKYTKKEKPIIAQIWGLNPENYYKAGTYLKNLGFDGIDINMGCPVPKVVKQGACSALIKNHLLAQEIIQATLEGAQGLPVSIKTRLGFDKVDWENWFKFLLSFKELSAITVHGRIAKEMSKGKARWDLIGEVVKLKNSLKSEALIIGNGDIKSRKEALQMYQKYQVDGIMIGRGIFENPLLFSSRNEDFQSKSVQYKLELAQEHIKLFQQAWKDSKNPSILKKFFKIYIRGFKGANQLRRILMQTKTYNDMLTVLQEFLDNKGSY